MMLPFNGTWPVIDDTTFVAPGAVVVGRVRIGPNASIWYNSVVRGDVDTVEIGAGTNIQDGSILHQDEGFPLIVGDWVTVGHGAILHGCTIEDDAFIGMGATILSGVRVGAGAVVGAGALVLNGLEIPPGTLALGSPAKVIRVLSEGELAKFRASAERYLKHSKAHRESIKEVR